MASGRPPLTAIRIPRCNRISDLGLAKLASCCPSLQIVVLDNCPMITDAGVSCLVDFCAQSLASLSLRGLKAITAPCILAAIRECFRLESLDITGTGCEGDAKIEEARRARVPPAEVISPAQPPTPAGLGRYELHCRNPRPIPNPNGPTAELAFTAKNLWASL